MSVTPSSGQGKTLRERMKRAEKYCHWGRHYTLPMSHVEEDFEQGRMCLECQCKIAHNLTTSMNMPDVSAALYAHETRRHEAKKEKREVTARIRGASSAAGFVYYIRINRQIKIGYSSNVTDRMRHYPPGSELLAIEPGTLLTEKERHQDFRRYLVRGREWFAESDVLAAHIGKLREELGDPSALAYEFTKRHA